MPLSHFSVDLQEYEANDKDKLPFVVDITAFFRIADYRQAVGIEQAKNLDGAQIKIIANAGSSVQEGVSSVMDLFSASDGQALGSMLKAFKGTNAGQAIIEKLTETKEDENK